jgi:hypothetical protein
VGLHSFGGDALIPEQQLEVPGAAPHLMLDKDSWRGHKFLLLLFNFLKQ